MREALGEKVEDVVEQEEIDLTEEQRSRIKELEQEMSPQDRREFRRDEFIQ